PVLASREHAVTVWAEGYTQHGPAVAKRRGQWFAVDRIPDPSRTVRAGGDHLAPVGAELRPKHRPAGRQGRGPRATRRGIPHLSMITAGRDDTPAVGTERRVGHRSVLLEPAKLLAAGNLPNPRCPVLAGGDYPAAIGTERSVQYGATNAGRAVRERTT